MQFNKPVAASFFLTFGLLAFVQIKVEMSMLLLDRFFPGFGWVEIFLLALYASWITEKMLDPQKSARWRTRIWLIFSIVFFSQFALGLLGIDKLLMTGKLHIPVPAMILAGPIYRAERFFMPILFVSTVLLVGPAWCSHLCYVGAWDALAASHKKNHGRLSWWRDPMRVGILLVVILISLGLRMVGFSNSIALILGISFGLIGVGLMVFLSRKFGTMVHCVNYCPIGLLANLIGKISPFRIRIGQSCDECGVCSKKCRYDALNYEHIKNRKPGFSCTLCGDCIGSCKGHWINYQFLHMKPENARAMFIIITVSLHAVFLGVARI
jgi:polyferredoxin